MPLQTSDGGLGVTSKLVGLERANSSHVTFKHVPPCIKRVGLRDQFLDDLRSFGDLLVVIRGQSTFNKFLRARQKALGFGTIGKAFKDLQRSCLVGGNDVLRFAKRAECRAYRVEILFTRFAEPFDECLRRHSDTSSGNVNLGNSGVGS